MDKDSVVAQIVVPALLLAATLYAAVCLMLFLVQRSLIYFPQPRALPDNQSRMLLQSGDATLAVTVHPAAGSTAGAIAEPTSEPAPIPKALIYFGGNAEDVTYSLPMLAAAFPQHALYLLHYRGYGGSTGKPTEAALHADALALYDKVRTAHRDIALVGRSLGTGVAVRLASERPVAWLVLITPFDSMQRLGQAHFPWVPVRWLLLDKYESWRYAPRIDTPATLLVAEHDEFIPRESAERLRASFPQGVARSIVIPRTGHNTISNSPVFLRALREAGQ